MDPVFSLKWCMLGNLLFQLKVFKNLWIAMQDSWEFFFLRSKIDLLIFFKHVQVGPGCRQFPHGCSICTYWDGRSHAYWSQISKGWQDGMYSGSTLFCSFCWYSQTNSRDYEFMMLLSLTRETQVTHQQRCLHLVTCQVFVQFLGLNNSTCVHWKEILIQILLSFKHVQILITMTVEEVDNKC